MGNNIEKKAENEAERKKQEFREDLMFKMTLVAACDTIPGKKTFDFLHNNIHKICNPPLEIINNYINSTYIMQFKAKTQNSNTCYANAIAAVFCFASSRVRGREPLDFYKVREK